MPRRKQSARKPKTGRESESIGLDYFRNAAARMGFQTPSLPEATEYEMVRLSNNYWLMLTLYRNHWIARRIVDLPADDMTRTWAKLQCDVTPEDIAKFDRTIRRTQTVGKIRQAIKWARLYGGAGALMAIKGHEKILDQQLDLDDVNPGSYLGLIPFDRWVGIYPTATEISEDIERPGDWGLPQYYECTAEERSQSFRVHSSRILRFCGPEVPTPEFQAQMYWGISELEPVWEDLRKRDNASWAILNLIFRANIIARRDPDLAQVLSGLTMGKVGLERWAATMQAQNELLSSQSMLILGKDGEMQSTQYSFAGIGDVYAQFQMDIAGAAAIPVTRLFGRTITGLGQSNDADERYYEEKIAKDQDYQLRPQLDKLYPVICMSELGEVPKDLDFMFPSVRVLTEEEKADFTDKASAPVIAAYNAGLISQQTTLKELRQISDTTNVFSNITDEIIEDADEEVMTPMEMMGGDPAGAEKPNPDRQEKELAGGAEV